MTISSYLSKVLSDIRQDVRYTTVEVYKQSEHPLNSDDIYSRTGSISSGSRFFSGSLGWVKTRKRENTPGGFFDTGEAQITASITEKSRNGISLTDDGIYLVVENIKLKIVRVVDATETKDILLVCERLSE